MGSTLFNGYFHGEHDDHPMDLGLQGGAPKRYVYWFINPIN